MKEGVAARRAAAQVVGRVMREGAYSNRMIDASPLRGVESDHFRFLAYTTLRHLEHVDTVLARFTDKPLGELDGPVADILRVACCELIYGRAPAHAVVDSAVEAVKSTRSRRASGFVNGVLRSALRHESRLEPAREVRTEFPSWLPAGLEGSWPAAEVTSFLEASMTEAPRHVRARPGSNTEGLTAVDGIAESFVWPAAGPVTDGFVVQDGASVAVGNSVPVTPGELVLDMAAAPGGKACHLSDRGARVVATDLHLRRVQDGTGRSPGIGWLVADGSAPPFRAGSFDHVLLDAPCSGLGTLRRRPEIRFRASQQGVARLARRQRALLASALSLVRVGGTVTYAVCTITPEETVAVVEHLPAAPPPNTPGRVWGKGVLLGPHLTGTDGMFISVVRSL